MSQENGNVIMIRMAQLSVTGIKANRTGGG
jgi:hypothetical protein